MIFYKDCFGGDLQFQTIGDSAFANELPIKIKALILEAKLQIEQLILIGTDISPDEGRIAGNSVSLYLYFTDEDELRICFHKLSKSSHFINPLSFNYWGSLTGSITDQFGIHWLLNCSQINKNYIFLTETKPTT